MPRRWKNSVCFGSSPVGPGWMVTVEGAIVPVFAEAERVLLTMMSLMSVVEPFTKMSAELKRMSDDSFSRSYLGGRQLSLRRS